jgi:hypothetical protein
MPVPELTLTVERLTRAFIARHDIQSLTVSRLRDFYFPLFTELFFELLFDAQPTQVSSRLQVVFDLAVKRYATWPMFSSTSRF